MHDNSNRITLGSLIGCNGEISHGAAQQEADELGMILDDATREQALRTAQLPFIHPWVALMPDAHLGKGKSRSGQSSLP